jgi:hypothetical protein
MLVGFNETTEYDLNDSFHEFMFLQIFTSGSSQDHGERRFMEKDVIFVSVNYR